MPLKFNVFTGNFDQTGSGGGGGGASYIDGEVQNFSALPQTVGSPAVDSAYLVREAEGAWLLNRKPAGIYIRTANTGVRAADWTHASAFPDVFNDANLVVYANSDSSKNAKFDVSAIATGTTRTISVPNKNVTLDDAGDSRTPSSHSSSHASGGSDPVTLDVSQVASVNAFGNVWGGGESLADVFANAGDMFYANQSDFASASHSHELTALAATGATNGHVLTANGSGGVTFSAASGGGVTGASSSASDVLGVSGANITGVDANADRIIFFDDSAGKLTHLTLGSNALSIDGTTLKSQPLFPVEPISRGAAHISYIGSATSGNSSNAVNTSNGFVLFAPVYVRKSANYTTYSVAVSTAGSASSLGKMALYTIKATDATPDALVCQSGTFATDSTGLKQPTMASTFVNEGWYYMAVGTNSTTNMTFYGDTMQFLRGVFSGSTFNAGPVLLDYSQTLYANLWPNPWNGTGNTFRNAFHPITSLS